MEENYVAYPDALSDQAAILADPEKPDNILTDIPFPRGSFSNVKEMTADSGEVMMVNKIGDEVCEHCVYNGGEEKRLHRAANGHSRSVSCKEPACDKVIFTAKRKEPIELWRFLVLVALGNQVGAAGSRAVCQRVASVRQQDLEERELEKKRFREMTLIIRGASRLQLRGRSPEAEGEEELRTEGAIKDELSNLPDKPASSSAYPTAKIVRPERAHQRVYVRRVPRAGRGPSTFPFTRRGRSGHHCCAAFGPERVRP